MELAKWLINNLKASEYIEFSRNRDTLNFEILISNYDFNPVRKAKFEWMSHMPPDKFELTDDGIIKGILRLRHLIDICEDNKEAKNG